MANTFHAQDAACGRCTFFDDHAGKGQEMGLCRYNPPVSQPSSEAHGLWPVVSGTDWCGHYEAGSVTTGASVQAGLHA